MHNRKILLSEICVVRLVVPPVKKNPKRFQKRQLTLHFRTMQLIYSKTHTIYIYYDYDAKMFPFAIAPANHEIA